MPKVYFIKDGELCHGLLHPKANKANLAARKYDHPSKVVLTTKDIEEVYRDFLAGKFRSKSGQLDEKELIDSGRTTSQGYRIYYYMGKLFSGKTKREAYLHASEFKYGLCRKRQQIYEDQPKPFERD